MARRRVVDGIPYCPKGHAITGNNIYNYTRKATPDKVEMNCRQCQSAKSAIRRLEVLALPPDTPSVMGNYKEPLKPVEEGFGYMGTVAYDESQQYTQCHICGYFFDRIGTHIRSHGLTGDEYREKFSLGTTTPLTAPNRQNSAYQRWERMTPEEREAQLAKMREGRNNKPQTQWRKAGKSLYQKNKEGNCPDQLLDKIETLAKKLGRTPSYREMREEYKGRFVQSVALTFGSWGQALDILGLTMQQGGGRTLYTPESLVEILVAFKEEHGREAMTTDMDRGLVPHRTTFVRHFGTLTKAKEKAYGR